MCAQNVPVIHYLPQAELNFLKLDSFALVTDNSLGTPFALTKGLLKILALFNSNNQSGLLYPAVKPANQNFGRLFAVFTGNFYHFEIDYSLTGALTQGIS